MTFGKDSSHPANNPSSGDYELLKVALEDRIDYWNAYRSKLESGMADTDRPVEDEFEAVEDEIGVGLILFELAEQAEENPGTLDPSTLYHMSDQYLSSE
jgi:hypothetical protein